MKDDLGSNQSVTVQEFAEQVCAAVPKENKVYKVELRAEDYLTGVVHARELTSGDELYIGDKDNIVKVGDKFKDYTAVIAAVYYEPKKWWQFWKRKKQVGYRVRWL